MSTKEQPITWSVVAVVALVFAFALTGVCLIWRAYHPSPPEPPKACVDTMHPLDGFGHECEPSQTLSFEKMPAGDISAAVCRCPKAGTP